MYDIILKPSASSIPLQIQDTGSGRVVPSLFCGSISSGPLFTSLTNEVSVRFITDEIDDTPVGFSISFTFVDPESKSGVWFWY